MVEAPEAPQTPFTHPEPRGGVLGQKNLEDHLCAKFHSDLSSGLDFYREQTHKPTLPFMC